MMMSAQKTLKRIGEASSKGYISGLASSFNLADAQGIELISTAKKVDKKESTYFSAASGFASVKPKSLSCVCYGEEERFSETGRCTREGESLF